MSGPSEARELTSLPAELISLVLVHLHDDEAAASTLARRSIARASATCTVLRRCALIAWRRHALLLASRGAISPSARWPGSPPASWQQAIRSALHPRAPQLLRCIGDSGSALTLPRPMFGHTACAFEGSVYLFGGRNDREHSGELEILHLDTLTWSRSPTAGAAPSARRLHTATLDGHRMYIVGGGHLAWPDGAHYHFPKHSRAGDMHSLDLRALEWRAELSPPDFDYMSHTCVRAPAGVRGGGGGSALVVFGGVTMREPAVPLGLGPDGDPLQVPVATDALLVYDLPRGAKGAWRTPDLSGAPPRGRYRHAACVLGEHMVVSGGTVVEPHPAAAHPWPVSRPTDELFVLGLNSLQWAEISPSGVPLPMRAGHSLTPVGDETIIILGGYTIDDGGAGVEHDLNDMYCLHAPAWTITRLEPADTLERGVDELRLARSDPDDDSRVYRASLPVRSGHAALLLPRGGWLGLLVLGGRRHIPRSRTTYERHFGRDDAHWLVLR